MRVVFLILILISCGDPTQNQGTLRTGGVGTNSTNQVSSADATPQINPNGYWRANIYSKSMYLQKQLFVEVNESKLRLHLKCIADQSNTKEVRVYESHNLKISENMITTQKFDSVSVVTIEECKISFKNQINQIDYKYDSLSKIIYLFVDSPLPLELYESSHDEIYGDTN